jgi:cytochrome c553
MPRHQTTQCQWPVVPCLVIILTAWIATLVTALWSTASHAADTVPAARVSARGAWVAARCAACHGLDGNNLDPGILKLAGQLDAFLVLQLRNYKSGERPHPVMAAIAKPLSEREIRLAARHYARQPPMRHEGAADPALLKRGEAVFRVGKPGAPACQYCHGAAGQGVAPVFARLAGQHPQFIVASLQPYRRESSFANPYAHVMKAAVQEWSDEDIRAVAAYVGTLR